MPGEGGLEEVRRENVRLRQEVAAQARSVNKQQPCFFCEKCFKLLTLRMAENMEEVLAKLSLLEGELQGVQVVEISLTNLFTSV